jgi:hypothetical protein
LLRALRVLILRLEGDDATDRTHAIARLCSLVDEPASAEGVFRALCSIIADLAPRAASLDEAMVRRNLRGVAPIGTSLAHARAWAILTTCEQQLRARTRSALTERSTGKTLSLARQDHLQRLVIEMRAVGEGAGGLVVTGQPDVGKSALTLAAVSVLREEGAAVIALSLRDLPRSALELERLLDASVSAVLGATAVADSRLLVLDGAEVALQGKAELLAHFARAAAPAGLGIIAVAREDASTAVAGAVSVPGRARPKEIAIPRLGEQEVAELLDRFPALGRVGGDPRSRWLVGRLGLVEILLQSGAHAALPNGALSEADVFAAVWACRVRRDEVVVPGEATPDGRDSALVALAEKPFDAQSKPAVQDALALPSLRSDGLLLPVGPTAAWRAGDDFANDVVRDFATARLFVTSNLETLLAHAHAPRWALRATRLACQAKMIDAGPKAESVRASLQLSFDSLAKAHGERWADLPWEAIVTLGSAPSVLRGATRSLLNRNGTGLANLLRVVRQRFLQGGLAPDPIFVEPIVELLCDQRAALRNAPQELLEAADEVIAAWLASLAIRRTEDLTHPLRCRVRDELLTPTRRRSDEHRIRCLGLLGPDLDSTAETALRELARDTPSELHPCLEQSFAPISLSIHKLDLLLTLTEACYIEEPERDDSPWYRERLHEEGIRRHQGAGVFSSLSSPYYGPFLGLLRASFPRAVVVINRILNHAARYRVAPETGDPAGFQLEELPHLVVDLPGMGVRRFVGDDNVWLWYRGKGVGPYPCISAIVAIERVIDEIMSAGDGQSARSLLARIVPILLQTCENLAIPGLVVGTLVRYAHLASLDQFGPWLTHPQVWELEFARSTSETDSFQVHGSDPEAQPDRDRRVWSFREVGMYIVSRALLADDRDGVSSLEGLGADLIARAERIVHEARERAQHSERIGDLPHFDEKSASEFITTVRGWASCFQSAYFRIEEADGTLAVRYDPPLDVVEKFAPERHDYERGQQAWRLGHVYAVGDPAKWNQTLVADIAIARQLQADPPIAGPPDLMRAPTAVAAGVLESLATGFGGILPDDVSWAVDTLIEAASDLRENKLGSDHGIFPWGADRLTARTLPRVLVLPDDAVGDEQRRRALDAVCALAASPADEVRRRLAVALRPLWEAPCRLIGDRCMHVVVLQAFRQSARFARMSRFDPSTGRRSVEPLEADVESALGECVPQDLLIDRLAAPIVVAAASARSACCVRDAARVLRDALLEAYGRGTVHFAGKHALTTDENSRLVAEALLDEEGELLLLHVRRCAEHAGALDRLLHDVTTVATADAFRRRAFRVAWPFVMDIVLEAVALGHDIRKERHCGPRAFARTVPTPIPRGHETNVEELARSAAVGWPTFAELEQRIDRWLPLAAGTAEGIDALVGFLETTPMAKQIAKLPWVTRMVFADVARVANRSYYLPSWLERLRASGQLDSRSLGEYQRLIDRLAAAGDSRALRLQLALEQ